MNNTKQKTNLNKRKENNGNTLKTLSIEKLKALVYDQMVIIKKAEMVINAVENEIHSREVNNVNTGNKRPSGD